MTRDVDATAQQVIEEHLLVGPRPGQCRCGFGDETMPVRFLGCPHAAHLVEKLRAAGLLKDSADHPSTWVAGEVRLPILGQGSRALVRDGVLSVETDPLGEEASEVTVTVEFVPAWTLMNITAEYS